MIFDIHVHVVGFKAGEGGNYLCSWHKMPLLMRWILRRITRHSRKGMDPDRTFRRRFIQWIDESPVDRSVLLALDGVYQRNGAFSRDHTRIVVSNDYVVNYAAQHDKLLFGASIHPYRRDALDELDRVAQMGACLLKWIPSAQNITLDDPACYAFYERLASWKMPLLVHTGVEHSLPTFQHNLNDPRRLQPALERGVTVIGAHCGTRIFLHEKSYYSQWKSMALQYPNFYGDLSAFVSPLHINPLQEILDSSTLRCKIVFGSDFPVYLMPIWFVSKLGIKRVNELGKLENPFERSYSTMKALGVPDEVFARAENLLRLPRVAASPVVKRAEERAT